MLIPLKINTEYSLLKSTIKIDNLVNFLLANKIDSCAICDSNLFGVMEFYEKMLKNNLKPIIGLDIIINSYHIYLYAKNIDGYHNLLKIHTLKETNKLKLGVIEEYLKDIKIILPIKSFSLIDNFPDSYLGFTNEEEKNEALKITNKIVYYNNVYSLTKNDTLYLKHLEAISNGILLKYVNTSYIDNYLKLDINENDLLTTRSFCEDINLKIDTTKRYIPIYNKEIDSYTYLVKLAYKGLNKRLNNNVLKAYKERLDYELSVIKNMDFTNYFLIVYDYVLYAKKSGILVGPGRGSAAGSLVSYSLGITDIDPLKYDLLFERFLNPKRVTMPDIDIDFEDEKRGLVISYVKEKYGENNVAQIITFGTLAAKQVLRDVAKIMDIDSSLIDSFTKLIDSKISLKDNLNNKGVKEFLNNYKELKEVYTSSYKLEGLKRHISKNAAGVVICSEALDNIIPIIYNDGAIMAGISKDYLENLGILKMDFLAIKNLSLIASTTELIRKNTSISLDLNKIPLDDPDVYKLFNRADTEGIFQFESKGMRNLMLKIKPHNFSDLVASVALFRPGPMDNIDLFIRRKDNLEKVNYIHPDLYPILKETYGVIIYQEQVMQILTAVGGYTFAEADNIRRAMSKKKESIILDDKDHFINSAIKRGYNKDVAQMIYDLILKFANYGFNKAHSVSYALIGYQMAYLKAKFPIFFITNLLNKNIGNENKTKEYLLEARKRDLVILKPDINIATNYYIINKNSLMLPFKAIHNLGDASATAIIDEREKNGLFTDYLDFVVRTYKNLNKKIITLLIDASVLDSFKISKKAMLDALDVAVDYASLISDLDPSYCIKPLIKDDEEFPLEVLREKEYLSYGIYITNHPVTKYNYPNIIKLNHLEHYFNRYIRCLVLINKIKITKTKKGDNMAFISASDEMDIGDFVIFPSLFIKLKDIHIKDIVLIEGKVTRRSLNYQVNVSSIKKLENED